MKTYKITSKKYGVHFVKLDDADFESLLELGGKWGVCKMRDRFYVQKRFGDGKVKQLHRFLLQAQKGEYVDHINGDTLDNRRVNLRICSNAANIRNGRIRSNNSSGVKGVYWDKSRKKWSAEIKVNYKKVFIGRFDTIQEASRARANAEIKYFD